MLPDVQAEKPEIAINLTRVGATGIKKLVQLQRKNKRPIILVANFNIFVDLPSSRKGVNLSRNFEAIDGVLAEAIATPVYDIESLCIEIAKRVLKRHEYATKAEISMKSEYMYPTSSPATNMPTQEMVTIMCDAIAWREGNGVQTKVMIGVEVTGITACPCAQEMVKAETAKELEKMGFENNEISKILSAVPLATHNQRGRATIKIEVEKGNVSLHEIISIARESMSAGTCEILKREDEYQVVKTSHENPVFVEDSVRKMASLIVDRFRELPDESMVIIRQENEESIHQHNVVGEKITSMGDLRRELHVN
jgi:GTP cyclohydrolase-4